MQFTFLAGGPCTIAFLLPNVGCTDELLHVRDVVRRHQQDSSTVAEIAAFREHRHATAPESDPAQQFDNSAVHNPRDPSYAGMPGCH